ncbi:hypothetical protein SAMN05421503_0221 [Terribacillus aidingensis]|uniref:Uncharacterized protein n=1 Tax=Terribacillus aidingensis TaxID=586416 RepID=A0A285N266_9BACI|nr:hypothetical protein SAMN05421503_0221 [Terribacillus aidingensis]
MKLSIKVKLEISPYVAAGIAAAACILIFKKIRN